MGEIYNCVTRPPLPCWRPWPDLCPQPGKLIQLSVVQLGWRVCLMSLWTSSLEEKNQHFLSSEKISSWIEQWLQFDGVSKKKKKESSQLCINIIVYYRNFEKRSLLYFKLAICVPRLKISGRYDVWWLRKSWTNISFWNLFMKIYTKNAPKIGKNENYEKKDFLLFEVGQKWAWSHNFMKLWHLVTEEIVNKIDNATDQYTPKHETCP